MDRILSHWDGFCANWAYGTNFRLQHDANTDRFRVMPWGTDQTLQSKSVPPQSFHSCLQMRACLADAACEAEYEAVFQNTRALLLSAKKELLDFVELATEQAGSSSTSKAKKLIRHGFE